MQLLNRRHQMFQVASQAVELPDHDLFVDAGADEDVTLRVKELSTVRLGDGRVADQHGVCTPIQNRQWTSCNVVKKYATGCLVSIGGFWDTAGRNENNVRFLGGKRSYRTQERHQARRGKTAGLTLPVSVSAMWVRLS